MNTFDQILNWFGILVWFYGIFLFFKSDLGPIILQALGAIWRKKYLWFIGLFAGLTTYGGEVNFLIRKTNTVADLQTLLGNIRKAILGGDVERFYQASRNLWNHNVLQLTGYILVTAIILAVIFWLIIISQAAIIRIVGRMQQKKATGILDGLAVGTEKFWTLVQVNLLSLLLGWGIWILITAVPAAAFIISKNNAWSVVAHFGSILSAVISAIIIFLVHYATANVVLNNTALIPAVVDSWRLFKRNVLVSLEMALVLFTVNFVFLLMVIGIALMLVDVYTVGGFILLLAILAFVYAFFSAFTFSAWTMFYLRLVEGKAAGGRLGYWTNQLVNFAGQKKSSV